MAGFTLAYSQMTPWQDAFKHKFTRETAAQIPGILGVPPVGTEPQPTDITLHGRAWRTRYGNSYARLVWSGAHGGTVSVWRNGTRLMRTPKRRPVRELPRPTPRDVRLRAARCRRPALEPDHAHRVGAGRDSSRRRGDPPARRQPHRHQKERAGYDQHVARARVRGAGRLHRKLARQDDLLRHPEVARSAG